MKNFLSLILIASQLLTASAFATDATASKPSDEAVLLSQLLANQGNQARAQTLLSDYLTAAPLDGMQTRITDAAMQLGLITPGRALMIEQRTENAALMAAAGTLTQASFEQSVSSSVQEIFGTSYEGAQFKGCDAATTAEGLGIVGLSAFVFLVASRSHTTENKILIGIPAGAIGVFGLIVTVLGVMGFNSDTGGC